MNEALQNLKDEIVNDFERFQNNGRNWEARGEYLAQRLQEFIEGLQFEEGRKYIKVVKKLGSQHVVWGFVVKGENDKKFRKGDILKAASWAAPARNAARGNVLDGDFSWVRWTGPEYL